MLHRRIDCRASTQILSALDGEHHGARPGSDGRSRALGKRRARRERAGARARDGTRPRDRVRAPHSMLEPRSIGLQGWQSGLLRPAVRRPAGTRTRRWEGCPRAESSADADPHARGLPARPRRARERGRGRGRADAAGGPQREPVHPRKALEGKARAAPRRPTTPRPRCRSRDHAQGAPRQAPRGSRRRAPRRPARREAAAESWARVYTSAGSSVQLRDRGWLAWLPVRPHLVPKSLTQPGPQVPVHTCCDCG
jgi:hypothetical protein